MSVHPVPAAGRGGDASLNQADGIHPNARGARDRRRHRVEAHSSLSLEILSVRQPQMIATSRRQQDRSERRPAAHHPSSARSRRRRWPVPGDHRAVGQRQVNAARPDRRPGFARRAGTIAIAGQDITTARRRRAGAAARREDRLRLPVLPSGAVADRDREHPGADGDRRPPRCGGARAGAARRGRAFTIAVITTRRSCPAASSSASRSRARWPTIRR